MKYTPTYFDFDKLEHYKENIDMLLSVFLVYAIIFVSSWLYTRLSR